MKILVVFLSILNIAAARAECDKLNEDLYKNGFASSLSSPLEGVGLQPIDLGDKKAKAISAAKTLIASLKKQGSTNYCKNPVLHTTTPENIYLGCNGPVSEPADVVVADDVLRAYVDFETAFSDYHRYSFGLPERMVYTLMDLDYLVADLERLPSKKIQFAINNKSLDKNGEKLETTHKKWKMRADALFKKRYRASSPEIIAKLEEAQNAERAAQRLLYEQFGKQSRSMEVFMEGGRVVSYAYTESLGSRKVTKCGPAPESKNLPAVIRSVPQTK
jgi:hypothetical protein